MLTNCHSVLRVALLQIGAEDLCRVLQGYGMNPMQTAGFPFMTGGQEQGIGQMTPQQQAQAMLMLAQQQQQQLAAACAMGSMHPFNPSMGGAGTQGKTFLSHPSGICTGKQVNGRLETAVGGQAAGFAQAGH